MRCGLRKAKRTLLFLLLLFIASCKTFNPRQNSEDSSFSYGGSFTGSGSGFEKYSKVTNDKASDSKLKPFKCENSELCSDEHGKPTRDLSCISMYLNTKIHPLAWGARKAIATAYQSCNVVDQTNLQDGDFQKNSGPACRAPISHKDNYFLTAQIRYSKDRNEIDLFQDKLTDCTMFVGVAMAAAGLRITKNNDNMKINDNLATGNMIDMGEKDNDCLSRATFNKNESIRSGDVIVYRYIGKDLGHAVIIDKTGPDPFGLSSVSNVSNCTPNQIDFNKFDFTIIESGGSGMNRLSAQTYAKKRDFAVKGVLIEMAVKACKAKFSSAQQVARDENRHGCIARANILRHNGQPECINPNPPKLRSEECVENCQQLK